MVGADGELGSEVHTAPSDVAGLIWHASADWLRLRRIVRTNWHWRQGCYRTRVELQRGTKTSISAIWLQAMGESLRGRIPTNYNRLVAIRTQMQT